MACPRCQRARDGVRELAKEELLEDVALPGLDETSAVILRGALLASPRICQHCFGVYCAPLRVEARAASSPVEASVTLPSATSPELATPARGSFALEWPEWTRGSRRWVWTARNGTEFTCGGEVPAGMLRIGSDARWVQVDLAPLREFVNSCLGSPEPTLLDRLLLEMRRTRALAQCAGPRLQAEIAEGFVRLWNMAKTSGAHRLDSTQEKEPEQAPRAPDAVKDTAALYDTDVSPGEEERRRGLVGGWCPSCHRTADLEPCKGEDDQVYWGCRVCGHPRSTPTGPGRSVRVEHGMRCQLVELGPEVFWADDGTRRWMIEEEDAGCVPATDLHLAEMLLVLARELADRNRWRSLRSTIEQALVHAHFAGRTEPEPEEPS